MGPRETYNMSLMDVNKDGYLDAAFMSLMDKSISLYMGDGKSMLDGLNAIEIPTLRAVTAPLFGDIDNDGILDIVGLHQDNSRITIHKGLKDNNFRGLEVYGRDEMLQEPTPKRGALADYDNDGRLDLLFVTQTQNGTTRLLSRRNAGKGLDYQIHNLPNVQEEPFEWHKHVGSFEYKIHFHPNKPTIYWMEQGTLYQQEISQTGLLTNKSALATDLGDLDVLQIMETPNGIQWLLKGLTDNIVLLKENEDPCQMIDDLQKMQPMNKRNKVHFGYWNNDTKLDFITSNTCIYCTSNHILHIAQ